MVLKQRLDRGLDLFDPAHHLLDLVAPFNVEERDASAGPSGVAGRLHLVERAVGYEAQHHGIGGIDMAAEGSGEPDRVDAIDPELVHEQACPGIEGGLGQLYGADIVLGDGDLRLAVTDGIGEGAPGWPDPW